MTQKETRVFAAFFRSLAKRSERQRGSIVASLISLALALALTHVNTQVRDLLDKSYQRAWTCLQTHRRDLDLLANALIKHETLTGAEIKDLLLGKPIKMTPVDVKNRSPKTASASPSSSSLPVAKRPVVTQAKN